MSLEDNIKMNLCEIGSKSGRWLRLVQDRVQYHSKLLVMLELQLLLQYEYR
jgi:hypothetical protein